MPNYIIVRPGFYFRIYTWDERGFYTDLDILPFNTLEEAQERLESLKNNV